MNVLIVHDSKFGNGEKIAEKMREEFEKTGASVKISHVSDSSSLPMREEFPDLLIVGAAVRMFRVSPASKKWLNQLDKNARKAGATIVFGSVYLTHALKENSIKGFGRRYLRFMQKMKSLDFVYPKLFSGQVKGQEGPLYEDVLPAVEEFTQSLKKWMTENKI
ncbi:MAG: flavodoxin family protein [Spirochaetia bacterium]|nr:flavodoxin family protein [Spirochaetia bacterium]